MPMMPKRVKFRKSQRGKMKGVASRGNTVSFGEFGLQALQAVLAEGDRIAAQGVALHLPALAFAELHPLGHHWHGAPILSKSLAGCL